MARYLPDARTYILGAAGFTVAHKLPLMWHGRLPNNPDTETRPILFGEALLVLSLSTLYSPLLAPFIVFDDINRIEVYMRGNNIENYGYRKVLSRRRLLDFVFPFV